MITVIAKTFSLWSITNMSVIDNETFWHRQLLEITFQTVLIAAVLKIFVQGWSCWQQFSRSISLFRDDHVSYNSQNQYLCLGMILLAAILKITISVRDDPVSCNSQDQCICLGMILLAAILKINISVRDDPVSCNSQDQYICLGMIVFISSLKINVSC